VKKLLISTLVGISATVAAVAPAMAQTATATGNINVSSTTTKLCTDPVAAPLNLGEYNGTVAVSGSSNVTFKCTNTTPATVTISTISSGAASGTAGKLTATNGITNTPIDYTMSITSGGSQTGAGLGTSVPDLITVVGFNVPANQNPVPGPYSDTVSVTVTY
jgi:spore coat protein U-like protein